MKYEIDFGGTERFSTFVSSASSEEKEKKDNHSFTTCPLEIQSRRKEPRGGGQFLPRNLEDKLIPGGQITTTTLLLAAPLQISRPTFRRLRSGHAFDSFSSSKLPPGGETQNVAKKFIKSQDNSYPWTTALDSYLQEKL